MREYLKEGNRILKIYSNRFIRINLELLLYKETLALLFFISILLFWICLSFSLFFSFRKLLLLTQKASLLFAACLMFLSLTAAVRIATPYVIFFFLTSFLFSISFSLLFYFHRKLAKMLIMLSVQTLFAFF